MLLHDCPGSPFARGFGARTSTCCHRQRPAAVEVPDPEPSGSTILRDHGPRHSDVPLCAPDTVALTRDHGAVSKGSNKTPWVEGLPSGGPLKDGLARLVEQ